MTPGDIKEQSQRGNLPDLVKNGFVAVLADQANEPPRGQDNTTVDLESLTVAELKDMAKEQGVPAYYKMNKSDLVEALS